MNFKSKIFGFAAATALSLSMMSGALAADTATSDVGVNLVETECTVSISEGSNLFYGDWVWDGSEYVRHNFHGGEKSTTGSLKSGSPRGCDVTVQFAGLTGYQYGGKISNSAFDGSLLGIGPVNLGLVPNLANGANITGLLGHKLHTDDYAGSLALTDEGGEIDKLRGDKYTGKIVVTVTDAP